MTNRFTRFLAGFLSVAVVFGDAAPGYALRATAIREQPGAGLEELEGRLSGESAALAAGLTDPQALAALLGPSAPLSAEARLMLLYADPDGLRRYLRTLPYFREMPKGKQGGEGKEFREAADRIRNLIPGWVMGEFLPEAMEQKTLEGKIALELKKLGRAPSAEEALAKGLAAGDFMGSLTGAVKPDSLKALHARLFADEWAVFRVMAQSPRLRNLDDRAHADAARRIRAVLRDHALRPKEPDGLRERLEREIAKIEAAAPEPVEPPPSEPTVLARPSPTPWWRRLVIGATTAASLLGPAPQVLDAPVDLVQAEGVVDPPNPAAAAALLQEAPPAPVDAPADALDAAPPPAPQPSLPASITDAARLVAPIRSSQVGVLNATRLQTLPREELSNEEVVTLARLQKEWGRYGPNAGEVAQSRLLRTQNPVYEHQRSVAEILSRYLVSSDPQEQKELFDKLSAALMRQADREVDSLTANIRFMQMNLAEAKKWAERRRISLDEVEEYEAAIQRAVARAQQLIHQGSLPLTLPVTGAHLPTPTAVPAQKPVADLGQEIPPIPNPHTPPPEEIRALAVAEVGNRVEALLELERGVLQVDIDFWPRVVARAAAAEEKYPPSVGDREWERLRLLLAMIPLRQAQQEHLSAEISWVRAVTDPLDKDEEESRDERVLLAQERRDQAVRDLTQVIQTVAGEQFGVKNSAYEADLRVNQKTAKTTISLDVTDEDWLEARKASHRRARAGLLPSLNGAYSGLGLALPAPLATTHPAAAFSFGTVVPIQGRDDWDSRGDRFRVDARRTTRAAAGGSYFFLDPMAAPEIGTPGSFTDPGAYVLPVPVGLKEEPSGEEVQRHLAVIRAVHGQWMESVAHELLDEAWMLVRHYARAKRWYHGYEGLSGRGALESDFMEPPDKLCQAAARMAEAGMVLAERAQIPTEQGEEEQNAARALGMWMEQIGEELASAQRVQPKLEWEESRTQAEKHAAMTDSQGVERRVAEVCETVRGEWAEWAGRQGATAAAEEQLIRRYEDWVRMRTNLELARVNDQIGRMERQLRRWEEEGKRWEERGGKNLRASDTLLRRRKQIAFLVNRRDQLMKQRMLEADTVGAGFPLRKPEASNVTAPALSRIAEHRGPQQPAFTCRARIHGTDTLVRVSGGGGAAQSLTAVTHLVGDRWGSRYDYNPHPRLARSIPEGWPIVVWADAGPAAGDFGPAMIRAIVPVTSRTLENGQYSATRQFQIDSRPIPMGLLAEDTSFGVVAYPAYGYRSVPTAEEGTGRLQELPVAFLLRRIPREDYVEFSDRYIASPETAVLAPPAADAVLDIYLAGLTTIGPVSHPRYGTFNLNEGGQLLPEVLTRSLGKVVYDPRSVYVEREGRGEWVPDLFPLSPEEAGERLSAPPQLPLGPRGGLEESPLARDLDLALAVLADCMERLSGVKKQGAGPAREEIRQLQTGLEGARSLLNTLDREADPDRFSEIVQRVHVYFRAANRLLESVQKMEGVGSVSARRWQRVADALGDRRVSGDLAHRRWARLAGVAGFGQGAYLIRAGADKSPAPGRLVLQKGLDLPEDLAAELARARVDVLQADTADRKQMETFLDGLDLQWADGILFNLNEFSPSQIQACLPEELLKDRDHRPGIVGLYPSQIGRMSGAEMAVLLQISRQTGSLHIHSMTWVSVGGYVYLLIQA